MKTIKSEVPTASIDYMIMDLKSLDSVRSFAQSYKEKNLPLHLLINNAGIMNTPYEMSADNIESQFQVNHLSHFLLTSLLLSLLAINNDSTKPSRVINLSSRAHMRYQQPLELDIVTKETPSTYDGWQAYGRSKLSNILFTKYLAKKFPFSDCRTLFFSLHPGLVNTGLLNTAPGLSNSAVPVEEGIKTVMHLSLLDNSNGAIDWNAINGKYYMDSELVTSSQVISAFAQSDAEAEKLWKKSLQLCGLTDDNYGV